MKTIYLHGSLREQFGELSRLNVKTPAEAIRALSVLKPGFEQEIVSGSWQIIKGDWEDGIDQDQDTMHMGFGKRDVMHIVPALMARKKGGLAKILIGIAIIGAAFLIPGMQGFGIAAFGQIAAGVPITFVNIAMFGAAMVLTGISQMLAPTPKTASTDDKASYLFNGAAQRTQQGNPVPLIYGLKVRTDSVVVDSAVIMTDILGGGSTGGDTGGGGLVGGIGGIVTQVFTNLVTVEDSSPYSYG